MQGKKNIVRLHFGKKDNVIIPLRLQVCKNDEIARNDIWFKFHRLLLSNRIQSNRYTHTYN